MNKDDIVALELKNTLELKLSELLSQLNEDQKLTLKLILAIKDELRDFDEHCGYHYGIMNVQSVDKLLLNIIEGEIN